MPKKTEVQTRVSVGELSNGQHQRMLRDKAKSLGIGLRPLDIGGGCVFTFSDWSGCDLSAFACKGTSTDSKGAKEGRYVCLICLVNNHQVSKAQGLYADKASSAVWHHIRTVHPHDVEERAPKPRGTKRGTVAQAKRTEERRMAAMKVFIDGMTARTHNFDAVWSHEELVVYCTDMAAKLNMPFNWFDRPIFRNFLGALNSRFKVPSSFTIRQRSAFLYQEGKNLLRDMLRDRPYTLVIDEYVGYRSRRRFLGVGLFAFVKGRFCKAYIGLLAVDERSTSEYIQRLIMDVVREWSLERRNLHFLHSDGAAVMRKALGAVGALDAFTEAEAAEDPLEEGGEYDEPLDAATEAATAASLALALAAGSEDGVVAGFEVRSEEALPLVQQVEASYDFLRSQGTGQPLRLRVDLAECIVHMLHTAAELGIGNCPILKECLDKARQITTLVATCKNVASKLSKVFKLALKSYSTVRWLSVAFLLRRLVEDGAIDHLEPADLFEKPARGQAEPIFQGPEELEEFKCTAKDLLGLLRPLLLNVQVLSVDSGPVGPLAFPALLQLRDEFQSYLRRAQAENDTRYTRFAFTVLDRLEQNLGKYLPEQHCEPVKQPANLLWCSMAFFDPATADEVDEFGCLQLVIDAGKKALMASPFAPKCPSYPVHEVADLDKRIAALRFPGRTDSAKRPRLGAIMLSSAPAIEHIDKDAVAALETEKEALIEHYSESLQDYQAFEAAVNSYAGFYEAKVMQPPDFAALDGGDVHKEHLAYLTNRCGDFWKGEASDPYRALETALAAHLTLQPSTAMIERSFGKLTKICAGGAGARRKNECIVERWLAMCNAETLAYASELVQLGKAAEEANEGEEDKPVPVVQL